MRRGGAVKRWHTIDNIKAQTVADHSWGVACIIADLWPNASADLLRAALYHDITEHVTGDIPAPAKWKFPELANTLRGIEFQLGAELGIETTLNELDSLLLKIADMLELLWYCVEEERLGNKNFKEVFTRGSHYLQELDLGKEAKEMLDYLIEIEAEL